MKEFDLYGWVREFHIAFDLPAPDVATPLSLEERFMRVKFMREEIEEWFFANSEAAKVDALLDLAYFAVGSIVMIGRPLAPFREDDVFAPKAYMGHVLEWMEDFIKSPDPANQVYSCLRIAKLCLSAVHQKGSVGEMMSAVHRANMRKLWPDGKPRYREDGKVLKPPDWYGPEAEIKEILERGAR